MKKIIFVIFLLFILLPKSSIAAGSTLTCDEFKGPSKYMSFVVKCSEKTILLFFGYQRDAANFIVPTSGSGSTVVGKIINSLRDAVSLTIAIAIVVFGYKIIMGGVRDFKNESIKLILMMVFILWFLNYGITYFMPLAIGLSLLLVDAFSGAFAIGGCNQADVWERVDCIIISILGIVTTPTGVTVSLLAAFGALIFSSVGIFIVILIFAMLLMVLAAFATAVFTYILCLIALIFLFAISPAIIPLYLFQYTKDIVKNWIDYVISYSLQPCIVIGYMALMIAVLNKIAFGSSPADEGGINGEWNALLAAIKMKDLINLDLMSIKIPYIDPTWTSTRSYKFLVKLLAGVMTTYLLYMFMINVANFASEMTGLKAGSENLGNKLNLVNLSMTTGNAMMNPLSKLTDSVRQATGLDKLSVRKGLSSAFTRRDTKKRD